jgi:hypothetical protein
MLHITLRARVAEESRRSDGEERETAAWLARIDGLADKTGIDIRAHVKRQTQWSDDARGFIDALRLDEDEITIAPVPAVSARRTNRR